MTVELPLDCEDLIYPAYLDRAFNGSIFNPGAVENFAGEVSAAPGGLQVFVNPGNLLVEQVGGKATGFVQDLLYHVSLKELGNPYNSVVVNNVNPQLAQIILRVYDTSELQISGSSYARLEWLNGTPTSGATLSNRNGHASPLPKSSLLLADVLVPKNATSSSEFQIRDRRTWARGASAYQIRTTGPVSVPESLILIDSVALALRIECSGKPITLSLHASAKSSGGNPKLRFNFWANGVSVVTLTTYDVELVETNGVQTSDFSYTYTPTAGSYLFQPTVEGGPSELLSSTGRPILFSVKEDIRFNANNGTS